MKLVTRNQIENLARFKSDHYLTTSFFLDTDKSRMTKKEISLSFKNLLNKNKVILNKMNIEKSQKESLIHDLKKYQKYCQTHLGSYNNPGIAIFSCYKEGFWQVYELAQAPRNMIVFDKNPYVRPLSAIINDFHRICVLTLDRKEAKWYEVFMGEISPMAQMTGDVPSRVKEGGWEGYESKRIERHIEAQLRDFYKKIAKKTFDLFKKNKFDWLFLGCHEEHCSELESLIHPYVKEKLKLWIKIQPDNSPDKILKNVTEEKKKIREQDEKNLVQKFTSEIEKGGLATSGLKNTLRQLNRGGVQTLLVARNFTKPGKICPQCKFLFIDEPVCPSCQKETEAVIDVVDEAVEAAFDKNCQVKHIVLPYQLNKYGNIGAFLRYKI